MAAEAAAKRPRLGEGGAAENSGRPALDGLLRWLKEAGAVTEGLEFRDDGCGGCGVFASHAFSPGQVIASLPTRAVLSCSVAGSSPLGQAAAAAGASAEMTMWIYMAYGREAADHPWHPYLASLPAVQPDPTGWLPEELAPLAGTPVLSMVQQAVRSVEQELAVVSAALVAPAQLHREALATALTLERVLWARGMHLSRCFPAELAGDRDVRIDAASSGAAGALHGASEAEGGAPGPAAGQEPPEESGCLLPLFDMLNHKFGHPIVWESMAVPATRGAHGGLAEPAGRVVVFRAAVEIRPGDEVFNNYGAGKGNEQLLFFYGFAELDPQAMVNDTTSMALMCDFDEESPALLQQKHQQLENMGVPCCRLGPNLTALRLGPFRLGPAGPGRKTVPQHLLDALSALGSNDGGSALTLEMLGLLHASLKGTLAQAQEVAARSAAEEVSSPATRRRTGFVQAYCAGRRRVLETALGEVEDILITFDSSGDEEPEAKGQELGL